MKVREKKMMMTAWKMIMNWMKSQKKNLIEKNKTIYKAFKNL